MGMGPLHPFRRWEQLLAQSACPEESLPDPGQSLAKLRGLASVVRKLGQVGPASSSLFPHPFPIPILQDYLFPSSPPSPASEEKTGPATPGAGYLLLVTGTPVRLSEFPKKPKPYWLQLKEVIISDNDDR